MKKTLASVVSGAVLLSGAAVTLVSAMEVGGQADLRVGIGAGESRGQSDERRGEKPEPALYGAEVKASSTAKVKIEDSRDNDSDDDSSMRGNATSSAARERHDDDNDGAGDDRRGASSTEDRGKGKEMSEEHRSSVASFVKSLLSVANRVKGGIGEEVRLVASVQGDSASTSAEAIEKVEKRNPILVFLIGSDYKNLGKIRSELVTASSSIARLQAAAERTTDATAKAEIEAQITVLQDSQVKLETFVETHESSFSLFGWAMKLFGSK
ncbi:hypothetical protein HZC00_04650 [Candidatus Kaiserbacteria bacterium]|nr:hypothetical protein [Candidatus Kaiserbacteria bacterium]